MYAILPLRKNSKRLKKKILKKLKVNLYIIIS